MGNYGTMQSVDKLISSRKFPEESSSEFWNDILSLHFFLRVINRDRHGMHSEVNTKGVTY